ncbi:MAG TPA: hypothetical protein VIC06_08395 [Solirubrobacteraceae bacterium]
MISAQNAVAASHAIVQRTDPQAGSPAGVIYQIPLDTGRRDAAPVLHVGSQNSGASGGGGSGGGGVSGGSPGGGANGALSGGGSAGGGSAGATGTGAAGKASGAATEAPPGGGTPNDPSSIHSENGFGSSSQVPGVSAAALRIGAGVPAAHTAGSTLPSYLLMVLIGLAAVAVGLIASRSGGRGRDRP